MGTKGPLLLMVALSLVLAGALSNVSKSDASCTPSGLPGLPEQGNPYFLAEALPDTLLAGPGSIEYSDRNLRPLDASNVYGQLVAVERYGGIDLPFSMFEAPVVVVVPWAYDAGCGPAPWTGSARWLQPRSRRFFHPWLRDRVHWANGLPTFDAFLAQLPAYPAGYHSRRPSFGESVPALTIEQLFELFEILPTTEALERDNWDALLPVLEWVRHNRELSLRHPARGIGSYLRYLADYHWARASVPSVAGTYHIRALFPSGRSLEFYIRTADRPITAWRFGPPRAMQDSIVSPWEDRADGYQLEFRVARSEQELSNDSVPSLGAQTRTWPIRVRHLPEVDGPLQIWRGTIEWPLRDIFMDDAEIGQLLAVRDQWLRRTRDTPHTAPDAGAFVVRSSGRVHFEHRIAVDDEHQITFLGERVSTRTFPRTR